MKLLPGARLAPFSAWLWVALLSGGSFLRPSVGDKSNRHAPRDTVKNHPEGEDKRCWVFNHMPKSGSSTIKAILFEWWGRENAFRYNSDAWKLGEKFAEKFAQDPSRWRLAVGGYSEVLRRHGGETCTWFTMFRHPVDRVVSAFHYCRKKPQDQACASAAMRAEDIDLVTFARLWGNYGLRQFRLGELDVDTVLRGTSRHGRQEWPGWYMVKKHLASGLTGSDAADPEAALRDSLEPAKALLRDQYGAIGILEEFNTTLRLFDKVLDMPGLDMAGSYGRTGVVNANKRPDGTKEESLEAAWRDETIKSYLSLDIELYDYAVTLFHEQVANAGLGTD